MSAHHRCLRQAISECDGEMTEVHSNVNGLLRNGIRMGIRMAAETLYTLVMITCNHQYSSQALSISVKYNVTSNSDWKQLSLSVSYHHDVDDECSKTDLYSVLDYLLRYSTSPYSRGSEQHGHSAVGFDERHPRPSSRTQSGAHAVR